MEGKRVDFFDLAQITFEKPDTETFGGLALAYEAGKAGGSMPTVFNAANEKAVSLFLQGKVPYLTMADMIEDAMDAHTVKANPDIDEILGIEREVCSYLDRKYGRHGGLI